VGKKVVVTRKKRLGNAHANDLKAAGRGSFKSVSVERCARGNLEVFGTTKRKKERLG